MYQYTMHWVFCAFGFVYMESFLVGHMELAFPWNSICWVEGMLLGNRKHHTWNRLHSVFVHLAIDGHLGCSYYFITTDGTLGKIITHISWGPQDAWIVDTSSHLVGGAILVSKMDSPFFVKTSVPNFSHHHSSHLHIAWWFHLSFIALGEEVSLTVVSS